MRVAPPIEVADEDFVVRRLHGLSPIQGTDVDALLRNLGCRTLIVTGVSANVAIPNAVFDAVNRGYTVVVPGDAIAGVPSDYTPAMIRNTLALVATVATTDEVLACSSGLAAPGEGGSEGQASVMEPSDTLIDSAASALVAGPFFTLPSATENSLLWHGQVITPLVMPVTAQPACVHFDENAL